jgi:segregation and condensation protein A
MPLQDDYEVRLDAFQGPMDLLLYLIRRAEVDINDIPVAQIANQYFAFLRQLSQVDIDLAGEFLVMAATLVEIKSRTLAPRETKDGEDPSAEGLDPTDPRFELVQQLVAYQRFRTAADTLDRLRRDFAKRHAIGGVGAGAEPQAADESIELEDAHILDLFGAFERIMQSVDVSRLGDHKVEYDDTPIGLHQDDIIDRLERAGGRSLTLQEIFSGRTRGEAIGLFLALLELARNQRVAVRQERADDAVEIALTATVDPSISA